jgi:hypothetical protein
VLLIVGYDNDPMKPVFRLSELSVPAKITATAFLLLIGSGYLVAVTKIYVWHNMADGTPGLSMDDLRAVYHGLIKAIPPEARQKPISPMLKEVSAGGKMRKHLLKGGDPAKWALIGWLEQGAMRETFDKPGKSHNQDIPSPQQVIADLCIKCHNAADGEEREIPYSPDTKTAPQYALVAKKALTPPVSPENEINYFDAISEKELLHITHAHILSIPVFVLLVAVMFLHTGLAPWFKLIISPLPMIATCVEFACWWLARSWEPAVYGIAAAGAVFGIALGVQILCAFVSMWFGRKPAAL